MCVELAVMRAKNQGPRGLLERVHGGYVQQRRARSLSTAIGRIIPNDARVLDIGCGDGLIDRMISEERPDLTFRGIDVLIREKTHGDIRSFDGTHIPFDDCSFDVVALVDVIHHSHEPRRLLEEARRIATHCIVIKDVMLEGFLSGPTLRFMDRIGNERFGVACPFNFWTRTQWMEAFRALDLTVERWESNLSIYPRPASWIFERSFHFVARLVIS
ncbi:MAG TPA: class I SAM-dependent methyltransferase [Blastocatellia bacterium]|nr:class I SAM-dependent methyltransferase [Blastocatellia bacterium]